MAIVQLNDIDKYVDNIYEAVVIIAKRARQINDEQKRYIETELIIDPEIDDYDDDDNNDVPIKYDMKDYVALPKPTRIAMNEFLSGKLKFEYIDRSTED